MLSLFQQLAKSPSGSKPDRTRQQTIESAFSRVNARKSDQDASTTPSLTTATSLTDNSSEVADEYSLSHERTKGSAQGHATSKDHIDESPAKKARRSPRRKASRGASRTMSGETLVDRQTTSQEQLLRQSVQALDEDWSVGAMPGDDIKRSLQPASKTEEQSSTTKLIDRASKAVEQTKSVLGKRGRETLEGGKEKIQALMGEKRSSLRSREPKTSTFGASEGPATKRARFSEPQSQETKLPEPQVRRKALRKPAKRWLSHGLYIGQDRDFNPRLTESQNKRKKSADNLNQPHPRSFTMSKPMFSGQRTIEQGRNFRLPYNVFSPLPPGQPKPDEWKKTQKNVFIGDAANIWKKTKSLEQSTCTCKSGGSCDDQCINRFMLYECDDANCSIGAERCTNRSFADLKQRCKAGGKYNIGVEVMKTPDRGYGIRANRTFEPGQIIVEYTGEVITQEECDVRMHTRYKDAECYYLMDFDQSMILDATRGSIARFVNHSCDPNCRMVKWNVSGTPRMALFAGDHGIMTGEELTYDYNFNPYSLKNVTECRCSAENCRGVLGPKPREIREALNPIAGGGKRNFQALVDGAMDSVVGAAKRRKITVPSSIKDIVSKVKPKAEKPKPKPLPKGWVYPDEAQEFKKVNDVDPEIILRGTKRKSVGGETNQSPDKRSKLTPTKSENGKNDNRRRSFKQEDEGEGQQRPVSRRESIKSKASTVKKNVVRTVKGRDRTTPGKSIRVIEDE